MQDGQCGGVGPEMVLLKAIHCVLLYINGYDLDRLTKHVRVSVHSYN